MRVEVRPFPDRPDEPSGPEVLARIVAVVVTYHPEPARLSALLDVIGSQVESVIIVDNGSPGMADWLGESAGARGCGLELLERNTGVAAAHNVGIAKARLARADAVLLLDQDSLPAANMVAELRRAFVALTTAGEVVGAVGPSQIDGRNGQPAPFVRDIVVHRPVRLYYIMRNHLLLYGRRDTPARWVLQDVPRLIFKSVVFATAIQPRLKNLSMIVKGIQDGIRGKTGSYDLR